MKKVVLLNGHLVLKKNKTGVHIVHEELTRRIVKNQKSNILLKSLFFTIGNEDDYKEVTCERYDWIHDFIIKFSLLKSLSLYFLPIDLFCGKNDLYFCDGIVPITIKSAKKVSIVHDLMTQVYPENYTFVQRMYAKLYLRRLHKSDIILVESDSTRDDLIKYLNINGNCIKKIRLGCNMDKSLKLNDFEKERIDYQKKYYFYIGDMRKNKNLDNAIRAFHQHLKQTQDDSYFYIAGSKKFEFPHLEALVNDLGLEERVVFLGYVSDSEKVNLYQHCYALLFVSSYEGFGIPIIEAANFNKPFITSNTSSMKELGKGSSVLVDPMDIKHISSAMACMNDKKIYDEEVQLSTTLKSNYTWDHCYKDVWDIIEELLEQK